MNLKQLQFVIHVAETCSFSRAAELSFATQPTLSNAISQLEDELGGRLFKRTTRSVELTPFGDMMLPRMQEILHSRDELLQAAHAFHNPSHQLLRIGFSPLVDMQRLNSVLIPFRKAHPEVSVFFKECFIEELTERSEKQQIDIQIRPGNQLAEGENGCLFYQDNLFYLPALDDPQSFNRVAFELSELPATPVILTGGGCGLNAALDEIFTQRQAQYSTYPGQAMSYQVIEDWAALGIGAGILPAAKISKDYKEKYPLFLTKGQPAWFDFQWAWSREGSVPAHIESFIRYITQASLTLEGHKNPRNKSTKTV